MGNLAELTMASKGGEEVRRKSASESELTPTLRRMSTMRPIHRDRERQGTE